MKRVVTTVALAVVAVLVITLIVIGVFLDRIIKSAVENYGPQMTQTSVAIDTVHLSLLTFSAEVKGLAIGNPKGYKTSQAMAVGVIAVGINSATVFSDKVVIHSFRLESPQINFEGGLSGNNLGQILDNLNSSKGKSVTPATNAPAAAASGPGKKFEVDDLAITGAKVQVILTGMPGQQEQQEVTLPDIHLSNLGTGPDGITAADLTQNILSAISTATLEAVAKKAANFDKNAATLKQAGAQQAKQQLGNVLQNLQGK